jgi:hypothetical protein
MQDVSRTSDKPGDELKIITFRKSSIKGIKRWHLYVDGVKMEGTFVENTFHGVYRLIYRDQSVYTDYSHNRGTWHKRVEFNNLSEAKNFLAHYFSEEETLRS